MLLLPLSKNILLHQKRIKNILQLLFTLILNRVTAVKRIIIQVQQVTWMQNWKIPVRILFLPFLTSFKVTVQKSWKLGFSKTYLQSYLGSSQPKVFLKVVKNVTFQALKHGSALKQKVFLQGLWNATLTLHKKMF